MRPHLDLNVIYQTASQGTTIFNLECSNLILKKVESTQYEAARIVTGAWKGTSRDKLYANLGWESLNDRRIMRKLLIFYETHETKFPRYLYNALRDREHTLGSRLYNKKLLISIPSNNPYRSSFFPSNISDWNKLDVTIKESKF